MPILDNFLNVCEPGALLVRRSVLMEEFISISPNDEEFDLGEVSSRLRNLPSPSQILVMETVILFVVVMKF